MPFLAPILLFFGGWKNLVIVGMLSSTIVYGLTYVKEYDERGTLITSLRADLKERDSALKIAKATAATNKDIIASTSDQVIAIMKDTERTCKAIAQVRASKDPNGQLPVSEIIGDVLELLKKDTP